MKKAIVDFESYYDDEVSVSVLGNANYSKRADAYIGAILVDGEAICGTIPEIREKALNIAADPNIELWAANSNFDQSFWDKYYPKAVNPWQCLLDLGRSLQLPDSLATLTKCVLKVDVDKSTRDEMKGVDYFTLPEERQIKVQQYCMGDVIHTNNVLEALPEMTSFERDVALMTREQNRRGVFIDRALVEKDKTSLSEMRHRAFLTIPWRNDYRPLSYEGLKAYCLAEGIPCPASTSKKDEDCEDLQSEHPKLRTVISAMQVLRSSNKRVKKAETLLARVTDDDILPTDLIYCGAPHTRRWASRGFNIQNLEKKPYEFGGLSAWERPWIRARPGKILLVLDFAAIEPCCLNWLAGNDEFLALVAKGLDPYEAYARSACGWTGGSLKKERPDLRAIYKVHVLSGGFAGGAGAFTKGATDAGLTLTPVQVAAMVDDYRKANPKIKQFWAQMDRLIRRAALDESHELRIEMPTGEHLIHWHVKQKTAKDEHGQKFACYTSTKTKTDFRHESVIPNLWKGLLTENVTQRLARDVMAAAAVRLWKAGVTVLWTTHDEAILEIDDDANKENARKEIEAMMAVTPEWVKGLPLSAEGEFSYAYTKLK